MKLYMTLKNKKTKSFFLRFRHFLRRAGAHRAREEFFHSVSLYVRAGMTVFEALSSVAEETRS